MPVGRKRQSRLVLGLSGYFPVLHRKVTDVLHAGGQFLAPAITMYVLHDDLFHVSAKKPLCPLLVSLGNLLVERRVLESTFSARFGSHDRLLQVRDGSACDQQVMVDI